MPKSDTLMSPQEAAFVLGVSTRTVTRWGDDDKHPLTIAEWTPGGQRRFLRSDVEALAGEPVAS